MSDHDVDPERVARGLRESEEDSTADGVALGLDEARATLAEIWRRSDDDALRRRAMRALRAVIQAQLTMRAAHLRVGHDVRRKP